MYSLHPKAHMNFYVKRGEECTSVLGILQWLQLLTGIALMHHTDEIWYLHSSSILHWDTGWESHFTTLLQ